MHNHELVAEYTDIHSPHIHSAALVAVIKHLLYWLCALLNTHTITLKHLLISRNIREWEWKERDRNVLYLVTAVPVNTSTVLVTEVYRKGKRPTSLAIILLCSTCE